MKRKNKQQQQQQKTPSQKWQIYVNSFEIFPYVVINF